LDVDATQQKDGIKAFEDIRKNVRPIGFTSGEPQKLLPGNGNMPLILARYGISPSDQAAYATAANYSNSVSPSGGTSMPRITTTGGYDDTSGAGSTTGDTSGAGGSPTGNAGKIAPKPIGTAPLPKIKDQPAPKRFGSLGGTSFNPKPPALPSQPAQASMAAAAAQAVRQAVQDVLNINVRVDGEVMNAKTAVTTRARLASGRPVAVS
jgi:hypothetical protein